MEGRKYNYPSVDDTYIFKSLEILSKDIKINKLRK